MKKLILLTLTISILSSCVKDTFDNPSKVVTGGGGGSGTGTLVKISELRAMHAGNGIKVADNYVEGVVISDLTTGNIYSKSFIMQDSTGGIVVLLNATNTFALGDKVKVALKSDSLTKYNGLMQAEIVGGSATLISSGNAINALSKTVSDVRNNLNTLESRLVQISGASLSGAASYYTGTSSGSSCKVNDAGANIDVWTLKAATFGSTAVPTGTKTVTAIVSNFKGTPQLSLRSASDVQ